MLHVTKSEHEIDICVSKLSSYFTETWDYTKSELLEDNITVLTDDNNTAFFILRLEEDYTHYDFGFVDEELRNKGLGTKYVAQIIENAKSLNKSIRATVRLENIASYKTMLKNGFKQANTFVIGSSTGVEMIYDYPINIDLDKYKSSKESSCGLFTLSALSELKYKSFVKADDLNMVCVPNYGIQKETMIQAIMSLFKDYDFKVVSNYTDNTEDVFHLIEQHFTKPNRFALACIKVDKVYDHWVLITNYNNVHFTTLDSEYGRKMWTKYDLFSKMIQSNMFTILL